MKLISPRFLESARQVARRFFQAANLLRKPEPTNDTPICTLAVCLIFKNEADYLKEWLDYHLVVGVERFFLFNNNSDDNFHEVLAPYIDAGIVCLHDFPQRKAQIPAYNTCLREYGASARWIAFIDADEFLCPTAAGTVTEVLRNYEAYPAVALNWVMFSTSGHILKPKGLVMENYTKCQAGGNRHVRLIVNPGKTERFVSAHEAIFSHGARAVNVLGTPVVGPHSTPAEIAPLRVNHYWTRSVEEYFIKKLGRGDVNGVTNLRDIHGVVTAERNYNDGSDHAILRFLDEVKRRQQVSVETAAREAKLNLPIANGLHKRQYAAVARLVSELPARATPSTSSVD